MYNNQQTVTVKKYRKKQQFTVLISRKENRADSKSYIYLTIREKNCNSAILNFETFDIN